MTWTIDKSATKIGFSIKHMMITTVKGSFSEYSADLDIQPDNWAASQAEAQIDVRSIQTKDKSRDEFLLSKEFFSPAQYPFIQYRSTAVRVQGAKISVDGRLKIKDIDLPLVLEGSYKGPKSSFSGPKRLTFSMGAEIDRETYGLTFNPTLETGNLLVGKRLKLLLEIVLVQAS